jgi:uncharacterized repeat protein (TIGR01451 family)
MRVFYLCLLLVFGSQNSLMAQTQPCVSNLTPPSDQCISACVMCYLPDYSGTTAGYTAGDTSTNFCTTIENDQWIGLYAASTSGTITITPNGCAKGIEAAVYADCSQAPIACNTGENQAFSLNFATEIGKNYFLRIDGIDGDLCAFQIDFDMGTGSPLAQTPIIQGKLSVCPEERDTLTIAPVIGATQYIWSGPQGGLINGQPFPVTLTASAGTQVIVRYPTTPTIGVHQICVQPINTCTEGTEMCKVVLIKQIPPTLFPSISVCAEDLPYVTPWGANIYATGFCQSPGGTGPCDSVFRQYVVVRPPIVRILPVKSVCEGDSVMVCGINYGPGDHEVVCQSHAGCDSTIFFSVITFPMYASIVSTLNQVLPDTLISTCKSVVLNRASFISTNSPTFWQNAQGDTLGFADTLRVHTSGLYFLRNAYTTFGTVTCQGDDSIYVQLGTADVPMFTHAALDSTNCTTGEMFLSVSTLFPNCAIFWINDLREVISNNNSITLNKSGTYLVYLQDTLTQCASNSTRIDATRTESQRYTGLAMHDATMQCDLSSAKQMQIPTKLHAVPTTGTTKEFDIDNTGFYSVQLPVGDYTFRASYPFELCNPPNISIDYCETQSQIDLNHLLQGDYECPNLFVSILPLTLRRCDTGKYKLRYGNYGQAAPNSFLEVKLDSFLQFVSSTPPPSDVMGQVLKFDLQTLSNLEQGLIDIDFAVKCNAPAFYEYCSEAHIYPDTSCVTWDGPKLELKTFCLGNTMLYQITNTGKQPMLQPELYHYANANGGNPGSGQVMLAVGEQTEVLVPVTANIQSFWLNQVPNYPLNQQLSVRTTGCGGSMPMIVQNGDASIGTSYESCTRATGSYDPNDKTGYPQGIDNEHYIAEGSSISYVIRFQNTGTDFARDVVIRDTLSPYMNPNSIRPGASGHKYTWKIESGNVLVFTFKDIMLPDSNVNEPASHGAIEFTIDQFHTNPLYIELKNSAAIYFDFNDPIITNTTLHTNGIPPPVVRTNEPLLETLLYCHPNPTNGALLVRGEKFAEGETINYLIINHLGQVVKSGSNQTWPLQLQVEQLTQGMYQIKVTNQKGDLGAYGKFFRL